MRYEYYCELHESWTEPLTDQLNRLAADGWEYYNCVPCSGMTWLVFRRVAALHAGEGILHKLQVVDPVVLPRVAPVIQVYEPLQGSLASTWNVLDDQILVQKD